MPEKPRPECDKLVAVAPQSQKIGEFLEWLQSEKEIVFGRHHEHLESCYDEEDYRDCGLRQDELTPARPSVESLLAEFFDIDRNRVEEERRGLLEELRTAQQSR
jgi:hypothetical protein